MLEPAHDWSDIEPDVSHLVTEDDAPVDNWFQDKQARLLTETLDASWPEGRPFVSGADVGLFYQVGEPVVPDVMLSLGVEYPLEIHEKRNRSYFVWQFGKVPDVVIEIVSNRQGQEDADKLQLYARLHIPYYVIYDPEGFLGSRPLRIYQSSGAAFTEKVDRMLPEVGLGFTLWEGEYDGMRARWLRWIDPGGRLLLTGTEHAQRAQTEGQRADAEAQRAAAEAQRADAEAQRADAEAQRADAERLRREELEARLRELGVDPTPP